MIVKINGVAISDQSVELQNLSETRPSMRYSTQILLGTSIVTSLITFVDRIQFPKAVEAFASAAGVDPVNTSGFFKLLDAIVAIMDPVATCVVVFAGAAWMFGHRSRAIDLLIGVAAGTLIITHSHDLVTWLRHIM